MSPTVSRNAHHRPSLDREGDVVTVALLRGRPAGQLEIRSILEARSGELTSLAPPWTLPAGLWRSRRECG